MPYREVLNKLLETKIILGCLIFTPSGDIWWHTGNFPQSGNKPLDGYFLISEWVTYPQATEVAGVSYISFVNSYPDYWILTSTNDVGYLILQRAPNKYLFLCYLDEDQNPLIIQKEIESMALLFC